jgi:hypothetical protein
LQGLSDTIDQLRAKGLTVYVIGQSTMFAFDVNVLDYRGAGKNAAGDGEWYLSFTRALSDSIRTASAQAHFVDPLPAFCQGNTCRYETPTGLLFADYGHYSELGSADIAA